MAQFLIIQNSIKEILNKDNNAYVVVIDGFEQLALGNLKEEYPDRIIRLGIQEQNSVSFASGLALCGHTVFLIILGFFATPRALEQIKLDLAYNNANVKILACKSGLVYNANAGYSHYGIEDIANIRTLPNIKILAPSTTTETKDAIDYAYRNNGAYYIRLENIHSSFDIEKTSQFDNSNLEQIRKGEKIAIIATGHMVELALNFADKFNYAGISTSVFNATTLKPFDDKTIERLIDKKVTIVTMEEHTIGGLGSIVAEIIAKKCKKSKFYPIYIKNEKFNCVGCYKYLLENLFDYKASFVQVFNLANNNFINKLNPIKKKVSLNENNLVKVNFNLFGFIPLLKADERLNKRKNKPSMKYYLFNFIRIV